MDAAGTLDPVRPERAGKTAAPALRGATEAARPRSRTDRQPLLRDLCRTRSAEAWFSQRNNRGLELEVRLPGGSDNPRDAAVRARTAGEALLGDAHPGRDQALRPRRPRD